MKFLVNQQEIIRVDCDRIVAGSQNFVEAQFDFDSAWDELMLTVCFKNGDTRRAVCNVKSGEPFFVPWEVLKAGNLYVYIEGYDGNVRVTTAKMKKPIVISKNGYFRCDEMIKPPSASVYDSLTHAYLIAQQSVDALREDAANGIFDGKDLEFTWEGTSLGVKKQGEDEFRFVDLKGEKGEASDVSAEALNSALEPISTIVDKVADCCIEKIEIESENKFDPSKAEYKWISGGQWVDNETCLKSNLIACNVGDTIYTRLWRESENRFVNSTFNAFLIGTDGTINYNKSGCYGQYVVPTLPATITELAGVIIVIEQGEYGFDDKEHIMVTINNIPTAFVPFATYTEEINLVAKNTQEIENLKQNVHFSRWQGKNVLVFGDSISTDNYPVSEDRYPKWATALKEEIGCNLYNYSVHGYGFLCGQGTTEQGQYNMINQIETAYTELSTSGVLPDLVILFMGTNDYGNSVPIGAFGDGMYTTTYNTDTYLTSKMIDNLTSINTFYGAVEHCMARIKELWQNAHVVVLTPLQREYQSSPNGTENQSLWDYCKIIMDTANLFSFPIKDLYHEANFCPINPHDRQKTYMFPESSPAAGEYDGLHPNEDFCKNSLMPTIQKFIENI